MQHRPSVRGSAGPSRYKADADTQFAKLRGCVVTRAASPAHASLSEDQIVCQSKLYDAFELQDLEQQVDRKLSICNDHESKLYDASELQQLARKPNLLKDHDTRSFRSLISNQKSPINRTKSLISVSNLLNVDSLSRPDQQARRCSCNFRSADTLPRSLIDNPALPDCKQLFLTASNSFMQSDCLQVEASCSCCNNHGANMNDLLAQHEEKNAPLCALHRAFSMPHFHSHDHIRYAGQHSLAMPASDQELGLQDLQDQCGITSAVKGMKAHKEIGAKRSRWSVINSLFGSFRAVHKKKDRIRVLQDEASNSTSLSVANQRHRNEYQHPHHDRVHCHYHHHYHHQVLLKGYHSKEVDWPLSPTRLQELGLLMPKSYAKMENFEQLDWSSLSSACLQDVDWLMPKNSSKLESFEQIDWPLSPTHLQQLDPHLDWLRPNDSTKMEDLYANG